MKIKSLIVAAVVALFATSSLSAKSLVIYFSRADENYGVGTITEGNTAILGVWCITLRKWKVVIVNSTSLPNSDYFLYTFFR